MFDVDGDALIVADRYSKCIDAGLTTVKLMDLPVFAKNTRVIRTNKGGDSGCSSSMDQIAVVYMTQRLSQDRLAECRALHYPTDLAKAR